VANRPYITAMQVRYSKLWRRHVAELLEAEARAEVSRRSRRTPKGPDPKTNNAKEA